MMAGTFASFDPASAAHRRTDVHAHLAPVDSARLASIPGVRWLDGPGVLEVDGHKLGMAKLYRPEALVTWMDEHGIETALISIPPPLYRQGQNADDAETWCRYVNDGLLGIAARSKGRFRALLHLPLEHPSLVAGLAEGYAKCGAAGYALAAGSHPGIVFSDAAYEPLWKILDAASSFVFLHPGTCGDGRLAPFYLENLVGNPMETGVAAAHLAMAGIPQKYPDIRFCLAHGGGTFPLLAGRLQRGYDTGRPGVDKTLERPLNQARRLYCDCITHHESALHLAKSIFGADHVLFGSDWPFPMGITEPEFK